MAEPYLDGKRLVNYTANTLDDTKRRGDLFMGFVGLAAPTTAIDGDYWVTNNKNVLVMKGGQWVASTYEPILNDQFDNTDDGRRYTLTTKGWTANATADDIVILEAKIGTAMHPQPPVATEEDLPTVGEIGDFREALNTGVWYIYYSNGWEPTSGLADLSNYFNKDQINALLLQKQDTLIAGANISIENNVISSTGGGGAETDPVFTTWKDLQYVADIAALEEKIGTAVHPKSPVPSEEDLPTPAEVGDYREVLDTGVFYIYYVENENDIEIGHWEPTGGLTDLSDIYARLQDQATAIAQESSDRSQGDASLTSTIRMVSDEVDMKASQFDLTQEVIARGNMETVLQNNINASNTAISQEIADREADTSNLSDRLTTETANRIAGDTNTLNTARAYADTLIGGAFEPDWDEQEAISVPTNFWPNAEMTSSNPSTFGTPYITQKSGFYFVRYVATVDTVAGGRLIADLFVNNAVVSSNFFQFYQDVTGNQYTERNFSVVPVDANSMIHIETRIAEGVNVTVSPNDAAQIIYFPPKAAAIPTEDTYTKAEIDKKIAAVSGGFIPDTSAQETVQFVFPSGSGNNYILSEELTVQKTGWYLFYYSALCTLNQPWSINIDLLVDDEILDVNWFITPNQINAAFVITMKLTLIEAGSKVQLRLSCGAPGFSITPNGNLSTVLFYPPKASPAPIDSGVTSVNTKTGDVVLNATDVGAYRIDEVDNLLDGLDGAIQTGFESANVYADTIVGQEVENRSNADSALDVRIATLEATPGALKMISRAVRIIGGSVSLDYNFSGDTTGKLWGWYLLSNEGNTYLPMTQLKFEGYTNYSATPQYTAGLVRVVFSTNTDTNVIADYVWSETLVPPYLETVPMIHDHETRITSLEEATDEVTYTKEDTMYQSDIDIAHVQSPNGDMALTPMTESIAHAQNDVGYWTVLQDAQNKILANQALLTKQQDDINSLLLRVAELEENPIEPPPIYDMSNPLVLKTPPLIGALFIEVGGINNIGTGWTAPSDGKIVIDGASTIGLLTPTWIAVDGEKVDPSNPLAVLTLIGGGSSGEFTINAGQVLTESGMGNVTFYSEI